MGTSATRHLVVGTAGHIDHGKTALVRRLTGVDTDRLPEEQRRGITIALGFAPLRLPNGTQLSVVDVPGHERFVKTMVAGATGLDLVLLVVAADEGVMPQTREHVEICQLLGVQKAIVALTKIDRAGQELSQLAREDVIGALAETPFAGCPLVPCSSVTGEGIEALLAELTNAVEGIRDRPSSELLSMPIDRVFSVRGFGTVVTGTVRAGRLAAGDPVEVAPELPGHPIGVVRARGIEVFHQRADVAYAGDRAAINLAGVEQQHLSPGQVITKPGSLRPSRLLDVRLLHLTSRQKPLKSGSPLMLHVGTVQVEARLTLLDADQLEPGARGFARLRLAGPIAVLPQDRFILRGFEVQGTSRTVGGGVVLDPEPGRRKRHDPRTLETMVALDQQQLDRGPSGRIEAAVALVAERGPRGLEIQALNRRLGVASADAVLATAGHQRRLAVVQDRAVVVTALAALEAQVLAQVDRIHRDQPLRPGLPLHELTTGTTRAIPSAILAEAAQRLVAARKILLGPEGLRRPGHVGVSDAMRTRVRQLFAAKGLEPPSLEEVSKQVSLEAQALREVIASMVKAGELLRGSAEIFFAKEAFDRAKGQLLEVLAERGELTTADAKTRTGISRKYLIPLLEALDRAQVTVRVGDVRKAARKSPS